MSWRLCNLLFGWDYIAWTNSCDQGIARVRKDGAGKVWYWRYPSVSVSDRITDPDRVIWLTCPPSKYFEEPQC